MGFRTPQLYVPAPPFRDNLPRIGCLSGSRGLEGPKLRPAPERRTQKSFVSSDLSDTLPRLPSIVQIGFTLLPRLPDWQRQTLHPPQRASKTEEAAQRIHTLAEIRHVSGH